MMSYVICHLMREIVIHQALSMKLEEFSFGSPLTPSLHSRRFGRCKTCRRQHQQDDPA